jgi:hypothetical protein
VLLIRSCKKGTSAREIVGSGVSVMLLTIRLAVELAISESVQLNVNALLSLLDPVRSYAMYFFSSNGNSVHVSLDSMQYLQESIQSEKCVFAVEFGRVLSRNCFQLSQTH